MAKETGGGASAIVSIRGCWRILPSSGIPGYVGQMNLLQPQSASYSNARLLVPEQLHPQTLAAWQQLRGILEKADHEGRITYCSDEQGRLINNLNARFRESGDGYWYGKVQKKPLINLKLGKVSLSLGSRLVPLPRQIKRA